LKDILDAPDSAAHVLNSAALWKYRRPLTLLSTQSKILSSPVSEILL